MYNTLSSDFCVSVRQGFYLHYPFVHLLFRLDYSLGIQTQSKIAHLSVFIHYGPYSMKSIFSVSEMCQSIL